VAGEQRAKELIAAAYREGALVAVSTAKIERIDFLRARFAVIRGATDPAHRRGHAQLALAVPSRRALQDWAIAHPGEKLAGGFVVVNQGDWGDFTKYPVWPESELALVRYTEDGHQLRAAWFDHFHFGDEALLRPILQPPSADDLAGISFREAWRRDDSGIEGDAVAFWNRLGILPEGVTPDQRTKDIILAAYHGGELVGLLTAALEYLAPLRARLAMVRGAVDPAFRRRRIGLMMMFMARPILERWSRDNPHERVAGIGAVIQAAELADLSRRPYSPFTRFMLTGFTREGDQLRVCWFEDFRLD
jgi:GNAT superfamily N-acetyltransferase